MGVKRVIINKENGQLWKYYCTKCKKELSREFYNWSSAHQFLGVYDCEHYTWVFVGDPFLDPPWDDETKEIVEHSVASARTQNGKYFLLPKRLAERYS
jgi:hypothetical protein